ncbi:MAG: rRNA maturation RNAse YbeY [bacterium]
MTFCIEIANRQQALRVKIPALRLLLAFFLSRATRHLPPSLQWGCVTAILVNDNTIRQYNRAVFRRDETTDVITQAYAPFPVEAHGLRAGEIVVNAQRASTLGPCYGGVAGELALYLAHGVDHLTDADDATPSGSRRMRQRELRWCAAARHAGLLQDLLRSVPPC